MTDPRAQLAELVEPYEHVGLGDAAFYILRVPLTLLRSLAVEPSYEDRVQAMADALHQDCILEWQAIAVADPTRLVTQHMADAHYGRAHDLVRRLHGL